MATVDGRWGRPGTCSRTAWRDRRCSCPERNWRACAKRNQLTALFVFVSGGMDAARRLSRKGGGESRKCRLHFCEIDRRVGIVFVCGHPGDDGACGFLDLVVTFVRERQTNSDVFCGHDTSSFYLTVDGCKCFCDEAKLLRQKRMLLCREAMFVCHEVNFVCHEANFVCHEANFVL